MRNIGIPVQKLTLLTIIIFPWESNQCSTMVRSKSHALQMWIKEFGKLATRGVFVYGTVTFVRNSFHDRTTLVSEWRIQHYSESCQRIYFWSEPILRRLAEWFFRKGFCHEKPKLFKSRIRPSVMVDGFPCKYKLYCRRWLLTQTAKDGFGA